MWELEFDSFGHSLLRKLLINMSAFKHSYLVLVTLYWVKYLPWKIKKITEVDEPYRTANQTPALSYSL